MPKKITPEDLIREHAFAYVIDDETAASEVHAPEQLLAQFSDAISGALPERELPPLVGAAASERCRSELAKLAFERSRRYDRGVRNRSLIAGFQSIINAALSLHPGARLTDPEGDPKPESTDLYIDERGQFLFLMQVAIPYRHGGHLSVTARLSADVDRSLIAIWDTYPDYYSGTDLPTEAEDPDYEERAQDHAEAVNRYLSAVYVKTRLDYR